MSGYYNARPHCRFTAQALHAPNERGAILPIVLIVLVIMTLSGAALIRSTDSVLLIAGNYAFQKDLLNQAERVIPEISDTFQEGLLKAEADREDNIQDLNYFASIQPSSGKGIPEALLNVAENNPLNIVENGAIIRYVIERMCSEAGPATNDNCIYIDSIMDQTGGNALNNINLGTKQYPAYRISIWASGVRSGETFVQTVIVI